MKKHVLMQIIFLTWRASACDSVDYDNLLEIGQKSVSRFQVFCYQGEDKKLTAFFRAVYVQITNATEEPVLYGGDTPEEVVADYKDRNARWISPMLPWQKGSTYNLYPFNQSSLGVQCDRGCTVQLVYKRVSFYRVIVFAVGLALFFVAPSLATNPAFFYGTGILSGILASLLLLVYFTYKVMPVKRVGNIFGLFTLLGGFSLVIYFLNAIWTNFSEILTNYRQYVAAYVAVAGVVSFYVCYRFGPLENERSINLLQWTLQGLGLALIFASSHYQEASVAVILIALVIYNFPSEVVRKGKTLWISKFPPKVKPLTEEEFHEEGVRETKKALEELRKYAASPDCNAWKVVSRLKTPLSEKSSRRRQVQRTTGTVEFYSEPRRKARPRDLVDAADYLILVPRNSRRFAEFVQGGSHLTDEEILHYDIEAEPPNSGTDDSEGSHDDSDESISGDDI